MPDKSAGKDPARDIAERLLAGLYYHPDHMALVAAHEPTMPAADLDAVWQAMKEAAGGGDLDTARLDALLTSGHGALAKPAVKGKELLTRIRRHEVLDKLEAATYGHRSDQLEAWSKQLAERAAKERLATRIGALVSRIRESDRSLDYIAGKLMEEIQSATAGAGRSSMRHISSYVDDALEDTYRWEEGEDFDFLDTGFYSLDRIIGGLPVGELTIFAAPSGAGKTSFLLQLLRQVALIEKGKDNPRAVAFFSIEMTAKQCLHRAAAAWKQINLRKARGGSEAVRAGGKRLTELHREALESLRSLPIYIDPDPEPSLEQIRSRAMQVAAKHDVALIGVDYDEKVDEEDHSEERRVSRISKGLKVIGKDLGAACVALSQYNSNPSNDVRPGSDDDLRYSRKKKHEAHTILHWYWPNYWIKKGTIDLGQGDEPPDGYDPHHPNRGILYCTKNRSGETGALKLDFEPEHTRFTDPNEPREYAPF